MPNFSQITIAGHVGADAETKAVGQNMVTEFSVAVTVDKKRANERTLWFRCALWGLRGEKAAPYILKGSALLVTGAFAVRDYEGKNGPGYSLDVNVSEFSFLGGGQETPRRDDAPSAAPADDEIPF